MTNQSDNLDRRVMAFYHRKSHKQAAAAHRAKRARNYRRIQADRLTIQGRVQMNEILHGGCK